MNYDIANKISTDVATLISKRVVNIVINPCYTNPKLYEIKAYTHEHISYKEYIECIGKMNDLLDKYRDRYRAMDIFDVDEHIIYIEVLEN